MEVVIPQSMDFDFKANGFSPYLSAPSTPRRFGDFNFFSSAPTSPSRMSEFYREFDGFSPQLGSPKAETEDFAFDFCVDSEKESRTAEELFDGGKIRPLKPPPRLQIDESVSIKSPLLSPRSPKSSPISQSKQIFRNVLSPRKKKDASSPFPESENRRGRERIQEFSKNSSRRDTRSLSPFRVSEYPWEEEEKEKQSKEAPKQSKPAFFSSTSSKRWRIKDFFLFRSASEGHARDKLDPFRFRKNSIPSRKTEDVKNSSFRSTESSGSSKRRVSAHEFHYTTNKAASENLKKKTSLPFKQGILGSLVFGKDKNLFRDMK